MQTKLNHSLQAVANWVEQRDYLGHEPADGNSSPLHKLTFGNTLLQRLLQQFVLRAPINVRPLLGIKPLESPQGRGYMAAGYLSLYQLTKDGRCRERAILCLDWLMRHKSPRYSQYSWGNNFEYATRTGKLPRFEPIVPWTALIGSAFLDASEFLGTEKYLKVAQSICDWLLNLPRLRTDSGICLSYHACKHTYLHNSNMLAAALLARTACLSNSSTGLDIARAAMLYSCSCQLPDGAWYYGEEPKFHWIDNFHTGYNLDALKCYIDCTGDRAHEKELQRGLVYFKANFFEPDGTPKYFHNRIYPVDIQCAAQAIETLALFAEEDPECLPLALKVAEWSIDNMQARDGHFYYRDLGWKKVKTPLFHWGQATMFKALAKLHRKLSPDSGISAVDKPAVTQEAIENEPSTRLHHCV